MGLSGGMAIGVPPGAGLGDGLIGTGFILAPHRQPSRFRRFVRPLDQRFFSSALGSWTVTVCPSRTRKAAPVAHHVRVFV